MECEKIKQYFEDACNAGLDNLDILKKYSISDLGIIFNGIGSDKFPAKIRELLNKLSPTLLPVAMIHDVEWHESDCTKGTFTASNDRFRENGIKLAKYKYGFFNPRRYLVIFEAKKFAKVCELFGWSAWLAPCECAICVAKRKEQKK